MSRIDEAMRRASQSPLAGRGVARADQPLRLAEESTLGEYPAESQQLSPRPTRPEPQPEHGMRTPLHPDVKLTVSKQAIRENEKLVVGAERNSVSVEQYRRLAATLHEAQNEKQLKTVMVTSATPKEGKTLTVINLALTLSESYRRRVLLIDADLRRPTVHEVLGIPNETGLSDVLRSARSEPVITQLSSSLFVLPSGKPDNNPLAGLSSERMRSLLDDFASKFDWVLLDTPPVGLLSDATVLGRLAQAAVFVIRAGATPFSVVDRAIAELGRDCIIGTVLNGVDEQAIPATGYYGGYYGER